MLKKLQNRIYVCIRILQNMLSKGRVQCFSMQVVINKCFLNPEQKIGADPFCCFRKKFRKMTSLSRKLGYSNNQLNSC